MPETVRPPSTVTPSTTRSAPTQEVLSRIRVRDPNSKNIWGYRRRAEDYELHWGAFEIVAVAVASAVVVAGLIAMPTFRPINIPMAATKPVPTPTSYHPQMEAPLNIPAGLHPQPQTVRRPPTIAAPAETTPRHLRADFLAPRSLEIQWDPVETGDRYVLYGATSQTLADARPLMDRAIPQTSTFWVPNNDVQNIWLAVRAVDAQGHETSFSRPLLVEFPPA